MTTILLILENPTMKRRFRAKMNKEPILANAMALATEAGVVRMFNYNYKLTRGVL